MRMKDKSEAEVLTKKVELPSNWCWATIGDTGKYINGFAFKPAHRTSTGLPIIRIQNLTDESKPLNKTNIEVPEEYHVSPGELLVSWSATLDAFIWNREKALVNQHIFRVVPDTHLVEPSLLYHWLRISILQLIDTEHLHGSTMKHINRGPFMAHKLPLPPLAEQTRIADKLEELFSDLDAGVAELKAAQKKLAQYRQSLLKAAVEGSLTAEWRTKNTPKETGAQLLERILKERRTRWEEKQLAKFKEQGKTPPKGWQDKYPEPVQPDTTNLPELPEGWVWASLDQICPDDIANGKSVPTATSGPKVLRLTAVKAGRIDLGEFKYGVWSDRDAEPFFVKNGDVLIVRGNGSLSLVGRAGLVSGVISDVAYPDTMIRVRVLDSIVLPAWLGLVWDSALIRNHLQTRARTSAGIYKIAQPDIISAIIPVPPFLEQKAIIVALDEADREIQHIECSLNLGLTQAAAQRKNILKSAFSGQLVPQDPNDEPASLLLERIRAERQLNEKTGKSVSKTVKKSKKTSNARHGGTQ